MSEKDKHVLEEIGSKIAALPEEKRDNAMQYISGVVTGMAMAVEASAASED